MALIRVESSTIHSLGYDPVEGVLTATFHCACNKGGRGKPDGNCPKCHGRGHSGTYTYAGVPAETYAAIRDAKAKGGSTGSTFNQLVKKAGYKFTFTPHPAQQ